MELRSERVLVVTGLVAWASVCAEKLTKKVLATPSELSVVWSGSKLLALVVIAVALASFGAAFAWVMVPGLKGDRPRMVVGAVILQTFVATAIDTDLAYLVVLVLPCVFSRRVALIWFVVWNAIAIPFTVGYVRANPRTIDAELLGHSLWWNTTLATVPHFIWMLWAFAIGLVATAERKRRQALVDAHRSLVEAQDLLADRARLEERLEIARELHDSIGHHLAALNVQLELASHLARGAALQAVGKAHEAGRRMLGELRDVISTSRSECTLDLPAALERLSHAFEHPVILVSLQPDVHVLDPACAKAIFLCAQEVIANAVRHSNAHHVWLALAYDNGWLHLAARDDGQGVPTIEPGNGLCGIRERVAALSGRVCFDSHVGGGVKVDVWLPQAR